jgi:hypothetical protein
MVDNLQKRAAIRRAFHTSGLGGELKKYSAFIENNIALLLENHPCQDSAFYARVSQDAKSLMAFFSTQPDPALAQVFVIDHLPQLIQKSPTPGEWETAYRTIRGLMEVSQLPPEDLQYTPILPLAQVIDTVLDIRTSKPELWKTLGYLANAVGRDDERFSGFLRQYGLLLNQIVGETALIGKTVTEKRCKQFNQLLSNQPGASLAPLVQDPEARFLLLMDLGAELSDADWIQQHQEALRVAKAQPTPETPRQIIARAIQGMSEKLVDPQ